MALFTAENAAQMARLAAESRRADKARAAERETLLAKLSQPTSQGEKEMRVEKQLKKVDELIDDSDDPKELNSLVQAKERLLNAWSLLTGFERPGIRRNKSKRSGYQSAQPIEPDPAPSQPMPAKPMGWEYD